MCDLFFFQKRIVSAAPLKVQGMSSNSNHSQSAMCGQRGTLQIKGSTVPELNYD